MGITVDAASGASDRPLDDPDRSRLIGVVFGAEAASDLRGMTEAGARKVGAKRIEAEIEGKAAVARTNTLRMVIMLLSIQLPA